MRLAAKARLAGPLLAWLLAWTLTGCGGLFQHSLQVAYAKRGVFAGGEG